MNKDGIHKWGPKDTERTTKLLWRLTHAKGVQQQGELKRECVFTQKTMVYLEDTLESKKQCLLNNNMGIRVSI